MGLLSFLPPEYQNRGKELKAKGEEIERLCIPYVEKGEFPP